MTRELPPCTQDINDPDHQNAKLLIAYMLSKGGKVTDSNVALARQLGIKESEFYRARNHVKDRNNSDGKPCTGYRLHYRSLGRRSVLALHDPTGDIGGHAAGALADILGWCVRLRQHQRETERQVAAFEALGDHALARSDKYGFQLCNRALAELVEFCALKPSTLGEVIVWAESLAAT